MCYYENNHGTFELLKNPVDGTENFIGVNGGSIDVADFNNDGWMDILVTGYHDEYKSITKLYKIMVMIRLPKLRGSTLWDINKEKLLSSM